MMPLCLTCQGSKDPIEDGRPPRHVPEVLVKRLDRFSRVVAWKDGYDEHVPLPYGAKVNTARSPAPAPFLAPSSDPIFPPISPACPHSPGQKSVDMKAHRTPCRERGLDGPRRKSADHRASQRRSSRTATLGIYSGSKTASASRPSLLHHSCLQPCHLAPITKASTSVRSCAAGDPCRLSAPRLRSRTRLNKTGLLSSSERTKKIVRRQ